MTGATKNRSEAGSATGQTIESPLAKARARIREAGFEGMTRRQLHLIASRAAELYRWFLRHQGLHYAVSVSVLAFLLGADYVALLRVPAWLIHMHGAPGHAPGWAAILLAAGVAGSLHSWLIYSLTAYCLHDGAAHGLIFPGAERWQRVGNAVASNLGRLGGGDPEYYAKSHRSHHASFGSEDDAEFVSYVPRRRYLSILLPLASVFNLSPFMFHRARRLDFSGWISIALSGAYHLAYGTLMVHRFGWPFTLFALLLFFPHVGFYLDRTRHFLEHNLMPLENKDGARSLGVGFWGLLVGGGPWGSPCHMAHHLAPSLPWYQQLVLHRWMVKLLTARQKQQFLIQPYVGFPLLWLRVWRKLS